MRAPSTLAIAPSITTVAEELAHALPIVRLRPVAEFECWDDRPEECAAELAGAVGRRGSTLKPWFC